MFKAWLLCHAPFVACLGAKDHARVCQLLHARYERYVATKKELYPLVRYALELTNEVQIMGDIHPSPEIQPTYLDRESLKGTLLDLKALGVDVKIYKQDTAEQLEAKLVEALDKLPIQETRQDAKVREIQSQMATCRGVLLDLRAPACLACPNKAQCMIEYVRFLDNRHEITTHADVEAERKQSLQQERNAHALTMTEYNPRLRLEYTGQEVIESEDSEYFEFFSAVCKSPPKTVASLRHLADAYFVLPEEAHEADAVVLMLLRTLIEQGYVQVK